MRRLAPLFSQGLIDPNEPDSSKKLEHKGIGLDLILSGIMGHI